METVSKSLITKISIVGAALVSTLVIASVSAGATNPPQTINGYTKDQCKNGGWRTMTDANGNHFKNQGDCVSYFATGGRNPGNG